MCRTPKISLPALLISVLLALGCARDLVTGKKSYNWFGLDYDVKLGRQVLDEQLEELRKKGKSVDEQADAHLTERIRTITRKIAAVSHVSDFPYEAHFADLPIVNAWCAPGGKVMVYKGLFDPKEGLVRRGSEDELAAVLGHEIAHATARHVTESISRNMSILLVGQAAVSAISASGSGMVPDMFNRVITDGINLYLPAYSRKNESEADSIGLLYMAKAGYNPQAAIALWYRACKKNGDKTSIYSSHPPSCARAKNLEKLLPGLLEAYGKVAP